MKTRLERVAQRREAALERYVASLMFSPPGRPSLVFWAHGWERLFKNLGGYDEKR